SQMTAGPDGVRDASSKQGGGFEWATGSRGVSRVLGSIDHAICSCKLSGLRGRCCPRTAEAREGVFMGQVGLVMSMAFVSLFDRGPFLRPDRNRCGAPRTAAVKAG